MPNEDDDKPVTVGMMKSIGIKITDPDETSVLNIFFTQAIARVRAIHTANSKPAFEKFGIYIALLGTVLGAIASAIALFGAHK